MIELSIIKVRFQFGIYALLLFSGVLVLQSLLDILMCPEQYKVLSFVPPLILSTIWLSRHAFPRSGALRIALEVFVFLGVSYIALTFVSDYSYDGIHYHLPGVISLLNGWNPFYASTGNEWVDHYPHGIWSLDAQVVALTGKIESGCAVNIILALSSFYIMLYSLFRKRDSIYKVDILIVLSLCFSPIVVSEVFTSCVDGALASLFLCLVGCLLIINDKTENSAAALLGALSACILLINAKLTGLYFAFLAIGFALSLHFYREKFHAAWLWQNSWNISLLLAAGLVGTCLVGYRPYVTNMINHGAIIYPPRDIILGEFLPANLEKANNLTMLAYAIFGEAGGGKNGVDLKWPWQISYSEIANANGFAEAGGFGPLFGIVVIIGCALFLRGVMRHGRAPVDIELSFAGLAIIGICLLFPDSWRARFIPMFPAAMGILVLAVGERLPKLWLQIFLVAMLLNIAPFAAKAAWNGFIVHKRTMQDIKSIKETRGLPTLTISADGKGAWVQHFTQRILFENGIIANFGECRSSDRVLNFVQPIPTLCVKQ